MGNFDYISFIDNLSEKVVKCNSWINYVCDTLENGYSFDFSENPTDEEGVFNISFFVEELTDEGKEFKNEFSAIETVFLGFGIIKKGDYNYIIFNKCFENLKYVISELDTFKPTIENYTLSLNPPNDLDIDVYDYSQPDIQEETKEPETAAEEISQENIILNKNFNRETIGLLMQFLHREGIFTVKSKTLLSKIIAPASGYSPSQLRKNMSLNAQTAEKKDKEILTELLKQILSELE